MKRVAVTFGECSPLGALEEGFSPKQNSEPQIGFLRMGVLISAIEKEHMRGSSSSFGTLWLGRSIVVGPRNA